MSDELIAYNKLGDEYWMHQTVNHSADEYVRGIVHTNTVEGYYSILRGPVRKKNPKQNARSGFLSCCLN